MRILKHSLYFIFFILGISILGNAQLPQKLDSLFTTIYASDLCSILKSHPDLVFIDVRSKGEYEDTSSTNSLNLGRIHGAINMDIETMRKNPSLLEPYRDKDLVIYCSHSQRSRKVSYYLKQLGFTRFYNLNGGMSDLTQIPVKEFPCKTSLIESSLPYHILSDERAITFLKQRTPILILDVRPSAQYESRYSEADYNMGRLKNAMNIPSDSILNHLTDLSNWKNKPVFVYGSGNSAGAKAALILTQQGFSDVYYLVAGYYSLLASQPDRSLFEEVPSFKLLDARRTTDLLVNKHPQYIFDTRPISQFENRDSLSYRNLGRIKGAIHVVLSDTSQLNLPQHKNEPILIYGDPDATILAKHLGRKGYTNINVLSNLYDLVWSTANIRECKKAQEFLVDHNGMY